MFRDVAPRVGPAPQPPGVRDAVGVRRGAEGDERRAARRHARADRPRGAGARPRRAPAGGAASYGGGASTARDCCSARNIRADMSSMKTPNSVRSVSTGTANASSAPGIASRRARPGPTARPDARRQRALAAVGERADDHGRDRGGERDPLGQHLARARDDHHHAIAIAPPPTPSRPERKPPWSPRKTSRTTVQRVEGQLLRAGAEAERDDQPQPEDAADDRHARSAARARRRVALTRAPRIAPARLPADEDRARLELEGAARRDRVGERPPPPRSARIVSSDVPDAVWRSSPAAQIRPGTMMIPPPIAEQAAEDAGSGADGEQPRAHARRSPSSSSATRRSCGVVTLKFSRRRLDDAHRAARALDEPRVVGGARRASPRRRRARARARRGGTPAASGSPTGGVRSSVATTRRSAPASLTVSVIGAAAIAASASASAASAARKCSGVDERARGVVDDDVVARRRGGQRAAHGLRARRAAGRARRSRPGPSPPGGRATTISSIAAARSAATLHSSIGRPARTTNALGRSAPRRSPLPAATSRATATSPGSTRRS